MAFEMKIATDHCALFELEAVGKEQKRHCSLRRAARSSQVAVACDGTLMRHMLNRFLVSYLRDAASAGLIWSEFSRTVIGGAYPADIAIWCGEPDERPAHMEDCKPVWLGCLAYLPYVGRRARGRMSLPEKIDDLDGAMLLQHTRWANWTAFSSWNETIRKKSSGIVQVDSFELIQELVLGGAAVAPLPAVSHRFSVDLVPLRGVLEDELIVDIWLGVDGERRNAKAVRGLSRKLIDFFKEKQGGRFLTS